MDVTLILGFLLTIIFGIPSYLALRKEAATRILFIQEDKINLYDKVVKTFKNLEIKYKGNSIKQSMFLLRGFFFCIGRKDITKSNIIKNISVDLSNESYWHECKIISSSKDLDARLDIQTNEIDLNIPLIKNGDFLYIEAIGESKDDSFEVNHRIANIPKIKIKKFDDVTTNIANLVMSIFLIIGLAFFFIIFKPHKFDSNSLGYKVVNLNDSTISNDSIPLKIRLEKNIYNLNRRFEDSVIHDYNYFYFIKNIETKPYRIDDNYFVKFYLIDRGDFKVIMIFITIVFVFFFLFLFLTIREFFRFKRIYFLMRKEIQKDKLRRK